MFGIFKKLSVFLVACLLFIGCGNCRKVPVEQIEYPDAMKTVFVIDNATQYQVDSVCYADKLPSLGDWMLIQFMDYETRKRTYKRVLVRTTTQGMEYTYVIVGMNEPFEITKRSRDILE